MSLMVTKVLTHVSRAIARVNKYPVRHLLLGILGAGLITYGCSKPATSTKLSPDRVKVSSICQANNRLYGIGQPDGNLYQLELHTIGGKGDWVWERAITEEINHGK